MTYLPSRQYQNYIFHLIINYFRTTYIGEMVGIVILITFRNVKSEMEQLTMKINWKVIVALVILAFGTFWGVDTLRTRYYSGANLKFAVGTGPVTVNNSSDELLAVQLMGTGSRAFSMSSSSVGVSGSSVKQGTGRNATQSFDFAVPPGASDFIVVRGADVNFVSNSGTPLTVAVQPQNADDAKGTLLVSLIAILGSLFYLSSVNDHRWISASRRQKALDQAASREANNKVFNRIFGR